MPDHRYYSAAEVAALCQHARATTPTTWRAACPVHNGDNPTSLHISQGLDKTLVHCFAHQCTPEAICAALGLPLQSLSMVPASLPPTPARRATPPATPTARQIATSADAPMTGDDLMLAMLLDTLDTDLSLLEVPDARALFAAALHHPVKKAMIEHRLKQLGHYPPTVYAIVQGEADTPQVPAVLTMSQVVEAPTTWLWYPYLAHGTLAMLDGDPGGGKSLLTLALATALSTGTPLPDQYGAIPHTRLAPQHSLFLAREDDYSRTVKKRLRLLGAQDDYVHYMTGWYDPHGREQAFTLDHFPALVEAVAVYEPALVVLDPIQAYLGAKVDMHRANETRPLLDKLSRLAAEANATILCVRHPAKASGQGGGKAMMRGLGSVDFIGAARTGLFVETHPLQREDLALVALSKSNIGPSARTQIFSKKEGIFTWAGITRLDVELLAGNGRGPDPHAFLEAFLWLEARLDGGLPVPAADVELQAEEAGFSVKLIRKAKKSLHVVSTQRPTGWEWRLPSLATIGIYEHKDLTGYKGITGISDLDTHSNRQMTDKNQIHSAWPDTPVTHIPPLRAPDSTAKIVPTTMNENPASHMPLCHACGVSAWQMEVSPPRCIICGARYS